MSDIDDELLALAGDSSSDEEDAPMNISRDSSVEPGHSKGGKKTARRSKNDSEEEGEASSRQSSPNSLRSAAMDESDSDDGGGMYEQGELYPLEGRFKDAADKAHIMGLPEIKREEELAERAQAVERDRQNRALRQLLNAREAGNKASKKRTAGAADLEENSSRKTIRQRTKVGGGRVGESSSGIDSLKRARAEKTDRQRRRQEDKDRYGDRRDNGKGYSDDDGSGESDVEWDAPKSKRQSISPPPKDAPVAELEDVQRVRVGRSQFALVCFYPGFNEAITGCFARISIGPSPETGENVYRMAVIKGFEEGKPYGMEASNGKPFITNQYLVAAHGKLTKAWPFLSCSNSKFTEAEFHRYKQTCLVDDIPLPTKPKLSAKIDDINNLVNRKWTEAELQEKLNRSGALKNKHLPIERTRLTNLIKKAKGSGDEDKVAQLTAELAALEGPKLAWGTNMRNSPKKTGPQEISQQERLAILNRENRRKNAEEVRQAQINERRAYRATEAALARGEVVVEDHSRRVKTKAKFKHDVTDTSGKKADVGSGTSTPTATKANASPKGDDGPLSHLALLEKMQNERKGLPTIRRPLCDDDIIGAIDLGIDIDI